jgi:hypothetical protein
MIPILATLFFIFGAVVALAISHDGGSFPASDLTNALATLIAAFVGAWSAFQLQARDKSEEQRRQRIAAGNRALFTLLQQANTLKLFQMDQVDPVRNSPGRLIEMRPLLPYDLGNLSFDLKELDFLANPKYQQVLFELSIEEARFKETLKTINMRSRLHSEYIQPALARAGIESGRTYDGEIFKRALGDYLYTSLESLTDAVVFHVDRTVASLVAMKKKLREVLIEYFPKERFIDFELLNESEIHAPVDGPRDVRPSQG